MSRFTLAGESRHELEIKKSRFLAIAAPIADADAALPWLEQVRDPAATHNCWAFRCAQTYRFSDDGEPGGSAGRPILAAIDGSGLDAIAVVVTRWYGGTKLGVGGLARAYGGSAAECLRCAERTELIDESELSVHCAFDDIGHLYAMLPAHGAQRLQEQHASDGVVLSLRMPVDQIAPFTTAMRDATRGRARIEIETDND